MNAMQLAPSILAADLARLGEEVRSVYEAGARWLHVDIMDGLFVPSLSFGFPVLRAVRPLFPGTLDVHLMINRPERYVERFAEDGADMITVHQEATDHLPRVIDMIHACGKKAGVALNPATPIETLQYVLEEADMVLLMTVNPGFGGQRYIARMTDKIRKLRAVLDQRGLTADLEVDGGIGLMNVGEVMEAGANVIVAGSSVFDGHPEENVRRFYAAFANGKGAV